MSEFRRRENPIREYRLPDRPHIPETHFEGYLCGDLDPAESALSSPTFATGIQLKKQGSNLVFHKAVTITNRDTSLTLENGTYIIWTRINGENRIVWAACVADISSSCAE